MKKNLFLMIALVIITSIAVSAVPAVISAQSADTIQKAESDSLGMIIKSIEMVENKPIVVAIFNTRTGKTIEYTVGDYAEGKLVRDILEDRVILYDELTKYQHVLIYNDIVAPGEEDEELSTPLTTVRTKKRDDEDMNITLQFNKYLNKSKGKDIKYGAPDEASEASEKAKLDKTTRDFKQNANPIENKQATDENEVVKPAAKVEVTVSTNEVNVNQAGLKKETTKTATVEVDVTPPASSTTKDGKTVKIR
ncbi:MAG TPA: hypothetical protein PKK26_14225 [Candidatus Wallbacteria bacterium]|nr:hypothetical protein [Candidatus Wallbacteria bacterium]